MSADTDIEQHPGVTETVARLNCRLLPTSAMCAMQALMAANAAKHDDDGPGWRKRTPEYYIEHARIHLEKLALGRTNEDHALHAATDMMLAIACRKK